MFKADKKLSKEDESNNFCYYKVRGGITIFGAIEKSTNDILIDCK